MHDSPYFKFAAMSAQMWLDPPQPLSARRIEVEALDGSFAALAPRPPVPMLSFPKRDDNWS